MDRGGEQPKLKLDRNVKSESQLISESVNLKGLVDC